MTKITDIQQAMEKASADIAPDHLVRFLLRGTCTLDTQKDFPFLLHILEGRFYFVKIKDESRLEIAAESYRYDVSLKGEFIRMVMASDRSDLEKEQIIRWGIDALSGKEIVL